MKKKVWRDIKLPKGTRVGTVLTMNELSTYLDTTFRPPHRIKFIGWSWPRCNGIPSLPLFLFENDPDKARSVKGRIYTEKAWETRSYRRWMTSGQKRRFKAFKNYDDLLSEADHAW